MTRVVICSLAILASIAAAPVNKWGSQAGAGVPSGAGVNPQSEKSESNESAEDELVVVVGLESALNLEVAAEALEHALRRAFEQKPLFVLLEIDCPGGQAALVERICSFLLSQQQGRVIAYIRPGRYGGAVSTAVAIALACDRLYMAENTIIGAAAMATVSDNIGKAAGNSHDTTDTGLSKAWQDYLASLAQRRGRPPILARAMADRNLEAVEILDGTERLFVDARRRDPNERFVRLWSAAGSLLTLTAAEALESGVADGVVRSRRELLEKVGAGGAEVYVNDDVAEALRTFKKVQLKYKRLRRSLDLNIKQVERTEHLGQAIQLLRQIRNDYRSLLFLAERYADLELDVALIAEQLDRAEAAYEQAKDKERIMDLQIEDDAGESPADAD